MITWMKKAHNFQIAKVQPQGVAQHLLDFLLISAWRSLQKCCLQKKRAFKRITNNHSLSQQQIKATDIQNDDINMSINLSYIEDTGEKLRVLQKA